MTETTPETTEEPAEAPKAAFAIEGAVTQTPTRIAWGLGGGDLLLGGLGVLTLLSAALGLPDVVVLVLGVVVAVLVGLAMRAQLARPVAGLAGTARVVVLAAAVVAALDAGWTRWWPPVLLAAAVVAEVGYSRLVRVAVPFGSHLPGVSVRPTSRFKPVWLAYAGAGALVLVLLLVLLPLPAWPAWVVAVAALLLAVAALVDAALWVLQRRRAEGRLNKTLVAYAPRFALHWDAQPGTGYQIGRWIPYLDRLGERYVVFVRNPNSFAEAERLTDQPVLLRRGAREMDAVMVSSLRAVFYVNNALRNVHVVRYAGVRHVQLNHGDSDKATSYNPVFRMFDRNFVAGQAAVDRFSAHGISTAPDFFAIVGRPQVEDVVVATPGTPVRRVLYAPTWAGMHADSAYSSLPIGPQIVRGLVERGCTVVFRPHPYTGRNPGLRAASEEVTAILADHRARTGTEHVFGEQAESVWTITDCFNAVDALVSDVSSVVPDFLYSEKPFAVAAMGGSVDEFFAEMPVARGGYVIAGDASNVDAVLDDLLGPDPQAGERHRLKNYYLGDFPAETYADAFLEAARREIA
ncbi:CDP-Glycerol:Poly(glycerophosphate) glycerophosphotransferase [Microlunatus sagamiharensis]|uniref:CDP-Glycerol:Poly(Glycerophosphate) glycerophosphotransferase n=1 Tax=Microlunatus sagamiharensis TaxID=546874 RepID=A0A1H2LXC7_9ACTN|nr:CDP-glycerol glycerophosphotransferase family protein [Microlunatus sagamiharensis]SDU85358.1 CDP-Glycerol:Poly(glycerophosphate) glycerophosphotransferase [Microlunatus sagamiharensis]